MRLTPERYSQVTQVALGLLIAIVISGAAVRLTGAGLGCDDWPNCNDERFVDVSSGHAAIEQVNRLFTGLVAVAVIAAVLGSFRRIPRRRDLTWLSLGLVAGVVGQVVLGGITVLVDLHPLAVQGHLLLSMVLVANAVVLVRHSAEPDGVPRRRVASTTAGRLLWLLAAATGVAIVTGTVVTGAGPHAGSEEVVRLDVTVAAVARIHGVSVLAALAIAVVAAAIIQRRPADRRALQGPLGTWIFVGLLQAAVGYTQYFNEVPAGLVAVHVAGATALWAVTVWLVLSTQRCTRELGSGSFGTTLTTERSGAAVVA